MDARALRFGVVASVGCPPQSTREGGKFRASMASAVPPQLAHIGLVVIGRNEGERLARCLRSVPQGVGAVVYVDSGSTDDSVALARSLSVEVVELDMSVPFTAARGRNAGFARLQELERGVEAVQFVDGDCALAEGWLVAALSALDARPDVVAVWGRRREMAREATPFNRLCDLEWGQDAPGETEAFGGDVMVRMAAVVAVGGYDARMIAGEDPDFAVRLRRNGGRLLRIDADMTWHDADMHTIGQWWRRAYRCGYAYGQVSAKHAEDGGDFWRSEKRRALTWGLAVPIAIPALAAPTLGASTLLLGAYPLRAARLALRCRKQGWGSGDAALWATNCIGASFPEALGVARYYWDRVRGRGGRIIEYKR